MKPTPPHRILVRLVALSVILAGAGRAGADPIADGRAALRAKNLAGANTAFEQAVTANPNNPEANVLAALTSLALLEAQPDAQAVLTKLGIPSKGRDIFHWTADAPKHLSAKITTDDFAAYAKAKVLPALVAADAQLAKANSPTFQTTLATDETGLSSLTLDLGDVLFMRSLLYTLASSIHATSTYNFSFKLADISAWLPTNAMTMQKLLATYPNLLTVSNAGELPPAVTAFGQAVDLYVAASDFMRARIDSTDRLFVIDPDYAGVEAKSRAEVVAVKASLTHVTQLDARTQVYAGAAATTPASVRDLLPQYIFNHPAPGTFPDVHFAGVLPDMTTDRVETYFQKVGNRLDHLFKHRDDPVNPTLVITSPKPRARVPFQGSEFVTVTGTARDNIGVVRVIVTTDSGRPVDATLTPATKGVNWTASIPVTPGLNTISAASMDRQGNYSNPASLSFTFVELADANLVISGKGSVSPQIPKNHKVELGKNYTFNATPAAGYTFAGWTEDFGSSGSNFQPNRRLSETFYSGVTLTANFVPNPYLQYAGGFKSVLQAYVYDSINGQYNAVNHGLVTLTLTGGGSFTGKVTYDGVTYTVKGKFNQFGSYGDAHLRLQHGHAPIIDLNLYLDDTGEKPVIYLDAEPESDPNNPSYAYGYGGKVTGLAAHFTVNVHSPDDDGVTGPAGLQGHGYFTLTAGRNGAVRGIGALADGSKLSFGSAAILQNTFDDAGNAIYYPVISFFASAGAPSGSFGGVLEVNSPYDPAPVFGYCHWSHPADSGAAVFQDAFELDLGVEGAAYQPPARKHFLAPFLDDPHQGLLSVAAVAGSIADTFTLDTASRVTFALPVPQKLTLKIDAPTGLFTGSYNNQPGGTGLQRAFGGVIRQDRSPYFIGDGFTLDSGASGLIEIDLSP